MDTSTLRGDAAPSRSLLCNLILVSSAGRIRSDEFQLARGSNLLGRRMFEAEGLSLSDAVSTNHAKIDVVSLAEIYIEDLGSKNGTFVKGQRVIGRVPIEHQSVIVLADAVFVLSFEEADLGEHDLGDNTATVSAAIRRACRDCREAAATDDPVLIVGETGTGKERFAKAIWRLSKRRAAPFVARDCGALPPPLLHGALFGHEKGAFTGAVSTTGGLFAEASGGTVFFDEIGNASLEFQKTVLRVIQERRFVRVGAQKEVSCDVRIISATNRDLVHDVATGRFAHDLYRRLRVLEVQIPPLRNRREDILPITYAELGFDEREARSIFTAEAAQALLLHPWLGNVRELQSIVRALRARTNQKPPYSIWDIQPLLSGSSTPSTSAHATHMASDDDDDAPATMGAVRRLVSTIATAARIKRAPPNTDRNSEQYFRDLYRDCRNNISEMSRRDGRSNKVIRYHLEKFGIKPARASSAGAQG